MRNAPAGFHASELRRRGTHWISPGFYLFQEHDAVVGPSAPCQARLNSQSSAGDLKIELGRELARVKKTDFGPRIREIPHDALDERRLVIGHDLSLENRVPAFP